jgi:hypothetical protein
VTTRILACGLVAPHRPLSVTLGRGGGLETVCGAGPAYRLATLLVVPGGPAAMLNLTEGTKAFRDGYELDAPGHLGV